MPCLPAQRLQWRLRWTPRMPPSTCSTRGSARSMGRAAVLRASYQPVSQPRARRAASNSCLPSLGALLQLVLPEEHHVPPVACSSKGSVCVTCLRAAAGRWRWQGRESAAAGRDQASGQPAYRPLPWLPAISGSRIDTAAQQLQMKQAYPGTGAGQTGPGAGPARCCSCRCATPATARWTAGSSGGSTPAATAAATSACWPSGRHSRSPAWQAQAQAQAQAQPAKPTSGNT